MMIAPTTFEEEYKDCSYAELINVRNELLQEIFGFENDEKRGIRDAAAWAFEPNPGVRYIVSIEYLETIIRLMKEKYIEGIAMVDEQNPEEQLVFINNVVWSDRIFEEEQVPEVKLARRLLNKLVKESNPEALNIRGAMFYEGRGEEQNQKKAVAFYKRAADGGCPVAMSNLGYAYFYGNGTAVNMALAYKYFSMAAHRGEWDAMNKLGDMYREGLYVNKDERMAFQMYDRCYDSIPHDDSTDAYPACLVRIAECLFDGIGVEQRPEVAGELLKEAERIFRKQIEAGNYYAKLCIGRVEKDLAKMG